MTWGFVSVWARRELDAHRLLTSLPRMRLATTSAADLSSAGSALV
jgi:hypothetical protein